MRSDAAARRVRIIDAACALFRTAPASEVTLERVAQAAGVGIATLYRNFADRSELMLACAVSTLDQGRELQEEILETLKADPDGIKQLWERYVWGLVELGLGQLVPALAPEHLADLPEEVTARREVLHSNNLRILSSAQKAGLADPALKSKQMIAQLIVLARPPLPGVLELEPDVTTQLVKTFLRPPPPPIVDTSA